MGGSLLLVVAVVLLVVPVVAKACAVICNVGASDRAQLEGEQVSAIALNPIARWKFEGISWLLSNKKNI